MTVKQVARSRVHSDHGSHSSTDNNINHVSTGSQGKQEVNGKLSNRGKVKVTPLLARLWPRGG